MALKTNQIWSDFDVAQLRQLASQNLPTKDIALRMGRTEDGIRNKAAKLNLALPYGGQKAPAWKEQDDLLRAFVSEEVSVSFIAKKLGRSEGAIKQRARSLGIQLKRPKS